MEMTEVILKIKIPVPVEVIRSGHIVDTLAEYFDKLIASAKSGTPFDGANAAEFLESIQIDEYNILIKAGDALE